MMQLRYRKCKDSVCQESQVNESQPTMARVHMLRHNPKLAGNNVGGLPCELQMLHLCAPRVAVPHPWRQVLRVCSVMCGGWWESCRRCPCAACAGDSRRPRRKQTPKPQAMASSNRGGRVVSETNLSTPDQGRRVRRCRSRFPGTLGPTHKII